ncbi:DNA-directed RNA polymerase subunit D [Hyperthermus butylicus]|uniref:DNA-directed RNA polymerase subunit Rpo3 n=1 Tax=Hyperthermus butylicus (strain DSM 5456 / JCM 9403 / PLM1-5) TaxID=415426 RepID=A2BK79_HYPBU|nr:DNA-directed RNA polymerase subunit D [Hyperthermus butylicus]ABM80390.1 DNA-directed RNA polymerase subunit D [Hyperthermus butylicus DSM 5456]
MARLCILDKDRLTIRLYVEGFGLPLVNAIRRAAYSDVPVMAVDVVEVFENNTVLYDEIIAHRLGLIPLTSKEALQKYKRPEECEKAELGDPSCYVVLRLEVETGPREERIVYSGDLETSDPDVRPVYDNMPIVVMAPDQRLRLQAYARLGYGREHAKWMPVSVAAHRYLPILEFNLDEMSDECIRCIESGYPELAAKIREMRSGSIAVVEDVNTSGLYWCVQRRCGGKGVKLVYDDKRFILKIESTGALPPEDIVREAARAIVRKAENLLSQLAELRREQG